MTRLQVGNLAFEIPIPLPSKLNPNRRSSHHMATYRVAKKFKEDVLLIVQNARQMARWEAPDRAQLQLTFRFNRPARRDPDNLIAASKPLIDVLTQAGIIKNDSSKHLTILPPIIQVGKGLEPSIGIDVRLV